MTKELSKRRVEGVGQGSLVGTLAKLLELMDEAVLVFDGAGRVLLANDAAQALMGGEDTLVGCDVRTVFSPAEDASGPFSREGLPFSCDGSSATVTCRVRGRSQILRLRCDSVDAPGETTMLVAVPEDAQLRESDDRDRTIAELRRANHRLSGALGIVLDTLDAEDVATLFSRVLTEIRDTMEADGTLMFLAEHDGFHLRGMTEGMDERRVPRFMPYARSAEMLATREGHAVRLRVKAPQAEDLRRGRLSMRDVVNEDTREVVRVHQSVLPPFASFLAVPVWFGGHVIAIIEVGWERQRSLRREDAQLLDSVAHYLAVQLMGAFTAMRTQHEERLSELGGELREELLASAGSGKQGLVDCLTNVLAQAAEELDATYVPLLPNPHQHLVMADLPLTGRRSVPVDLEALPQGAQGEDVRVVDLEDLPQLEQALRELGEPCVGVVVDAGVVADTPLSLMMLRPEGAEPLDEAEMAFLVRLGEDVRDIAEGEEARAQDKRISQALQTGMRNELQKVEGISAQGIYSSATAQAFVGGDFYDLIRLPGRRACVIMGDVSGKGVEAASVSAAVRTALGAYAWEGLQPARMVRSLNDFLLGFSRLETFATLFVGVADLAAGTLTYCSAGHPPAVLVRHDSGEIQLLDVQSGVVGAFHDMTYRNGSVHVRQGDVLLLYTDGTTEARDPKGAFFGEGGLRDMVMREVPRGFDGLLDRLLATLDAFTGRNLEDDVAMVALRFDDVPA